jgi:hypothetical protein
MAAVVLLAAATLFAMAVSTGTATTLTASLADLESFADFLAKTASAALAMSGLPDPFNEAPPPAWPCVPGLSDGDFCVPGEVPAGEDCTVCPSCGRAAGFWLEGVGDWDGVLGGSAASLVPSSNAANGPDGSAASADGALLRVPWPI